MTRNIVLIGMMGSGKSMIAKELSKRLNVPHFSTDRMIEKEAGQKVRELVMEHGWEHFRELERATIAQLAQEKGIIIDCGGGVVLDAKNLEVLRKNGIIFYLDAPPQVLYKRLKDDTTRPLLQAADPLAELEKIYKERLPLYSQADITLDASDPSIEGPVAQILAKV